MPGQQAVDDGIKMAFRLSVFNPGKPRHHCINRKRVAKLDKLASRALIQAKIMAFNRFFWCCKTIADGHLLKRQTAVVQQSTAQPAMETRRYPHAYDHALLDKVHGLTAARPG